MARRKRKRKQPERDFSLSVSPEAVAAVRRVLDDSVQDGFTLARRAGVSRVVVFRAVKWLRAHGMRIDSARGFGYWLPGRPRRRRAA